jgi:hypothetical protein
MGRAREIHFLTDFRKFNSDTKQEEGTPQNFFCKITSSRIFWKQNQNPHTYEIMTVQSDRNPCTARIANVTTMSLNISTLPVIFGTISHNVLLKGP